MFYYRVETRQGPKWLDDVVASGTDQTQAWKEVVAFLSNRESVTEVKVLPCKRNGDIIV